MNFKQRPYFVKGIVIGLTLLGLTFLGAIVLKFLDVPNVLAGMFLTQVFFIQDILIGAFGVPCRIIPATIITPPMPSCPDYIFWISIVVMFVAYAAVGGVAGYFYAKIRNRRATISDNSRS